MATTMKVLSWQELEEVHNKLSCPVDLTNGPTSSQSRLRLFGRPESEVRVTLFRDHHAWCPYCQKVWMFLEEKRIPYKVQKVTMFCYGEKESWYKKICPSGMLPAIQFNSGEIVTDSDNILVALEKRYGPLEHSLQERKMVVPLRQLERRLFSAWCGWLCYPGTAAEDQRPRKLFEQTLQMVDGVLKSSPGPFFLESFSVVDCIFAPFLERMAASLFYYKGFTVRDKSRFPGVAAWFDGMEGRETYRGTQSDFHTHVHDLPPQLGGCYSNETEEQAECQARVDGGLDLNLP